MDLRPYDFQNTGTRADSSSRGGLHPASLLPHEYSRPSCFGPVRAEPIGGCLCHNGLNDTAANRIWDTDLQDQNGEGSAGSISGYIDSVDGGESPEWTGGTSCATVKQQCHQQFHQQRPRQRRMEDSEALEALSPPMVGTAGGMCWQGPPWTQPSCMNSRVYGNRSRDGSGGGYWTCSVSREGSATSRSRGRERPIATWGGTPIIPIGGAFGAAKPSVRNREISSVRRGRGLDVDW